MVFPDDIGEIISKYLGEVLQLIVKESMQAYQKRLDEWEREIARIQSIYEKILNEKGNDEDNELMRINVRFAAKTEEEVVLGAESTELKLDFMT